MFIRERSLCSFLVLLCILLSAVLNISTFDLGKNCPDALNYRWKLLKFSILFCLSTITWKGKKQGLMEAAVILISGSEPPKVFRRKEWAMTMTGGLFSKDVIDFVRHGIGSQEPFAATNNLPLAFLGIFCTKEEANRRTLIRKTTFQLLPPEITARFVVCQPAFSEPDMLFSTETELYGDIYLIDCVENMNDGKSFLYFSSVRSDFPGFMYYAKTDSDTYLLFHNLALALNTAPRCLFYGGRGNSLQFVVPEALPAPYIPFMSGSFYILSQDLVQSLERCGRNCSEAKGVEDFNTAQHLEIALPNRGKSLGDLGCNHTVLYDRQSKDTILQPWHVLVHPLKGAEEWWDVHYQFVRIVTQKSLESNRGIRFWGGEMSQNNVLKGDCGSI